MQRFVGAWLLLAMLGCAARATAQEPNGVQDPAPADAVAKFDDFKSKWEAFSIALDRARYTLNNCLPEKKNEAILAYDTLIEQGNMLLDEFAGAAIAAIHVDPQNAQAERYLRIMIEATLANDRYEDARRLAQALIDQGKPDTTVCAQAAQAALELADLDGAEALFAQADELGDLTPAAQQLRDSIPEWRAKLARETELRAAEAAADNLPRVVLTTTKGDIVLELFEDHAPNTVANFIALADRKFYNDLEFYRVENNFAAVSGCPANRGVGGPGHEIVAEVDRDDRRPAMRGTVSMVNGGRGRCGSQFFIALSSHGVRGSETANPVFGRVVSGLDVVERLRHVNQDHTPKEFERDRILDARVERRRDHEYTPTTTFDIGKAKEAEAQDLMREGDFEAAERVLEDGLAVAPWWYNLRYRLGVLKLIERNDAEGAIPHLSRAAMMTPREPEPHFYLATAYAKVGEAEKAIENFEKVLKLNPGHVKAMTGLGVMYYTQRRFRQALEVLEAAAELDPDDPEIRRYRDLAGRQHRALLQAEQ